MKNLNVENQSTEIINLNDLELIKKQIQELNQLKKDLILKQKQSQKINNKTLVKFTNKSGEIITGYGELYYYVTDSNNKSHLKKASSVEILNQEDK